MPLIGDSKSVYVGTTPITKVMAGDVEVWPNAPTGIPSAPGYIGNFFNSSNYLLQVGVQNSEEESPDFPILGYELSYQKASANQFDESKWYTPQEPDYYWQDPPPTGGQMAIFPSGKSGWFCPLDPDTNQQMPEFCFSSSCYWRFRARAYTAAGFGPYVISDPYSQTNKKCTTPDTQIEAQWVLDSSLRPTSATSTAASSFVGYPQPSGPTLPPNYETDSSITGYWNSSFSTRRTGNPSETGVAEFLATVDDTYDDEWTVSFFFNGSSVVNEAIDLLELRGVATLSVDASQGLEQNQLVLSSSREIQRSFNFKYSEAGEFGHYMALTKRSDENFVRWFWNGIQQPELDTVSEKIGLVVIKNYLENNTSLCINDIRVWNRCIYYGDFEYPDSPFGVS